MDRMRWSWLAGVERQALPGDPRRMIRIVGECPAAGKFDRKDKNRELEKKALLRLEWYSRKSHAKAGME
ncbi:hypothetical protein NECAME_16913 [Necator americanus]|uniref:Uncharacterized protein n=1 Tax=Necator americanus TaxID=51031 RepID=W2TVJ8_NECAM|nr:hypothetical protein NECAME_16913 [Necator americanus]ETN85091.1 hypothetical protein NECAME_16913 [Necator americanus]